MTENFKSSQDERTLKVNKQTAQDVIREDYGNSHDCIKALEEAGYGASQVQADVNADMFESIDDKQTAETAKLKEQLVSGNTGLVGGGAKGSFKPEYSEMIKKYRLIGYEQQSLTGIRKYIILFNNIFL